MDKLKKLLDELGWDEKMAIQAINKYIEDKERKRKIAKEYYLKNKERLDQYHSEYRRENPAYRRRNIERAKRTKKIQPS